MSQAASTAYQQARSRLRSDGSPLSYADTVGAVAASPPSTQSG